mmetsp:Transcript_10748/g.25447  ORF Transcript_10748/g.25447 Transcript_10748/m.25447 type:complete len:233 (+) Transcript_10748:568-1266(+)
MQSVVPTPGNRLVVGRTDAQGSSVEVEPVELFDGLFSVVVVSHGDESESTGPSGRVPDHDGLANGSDFPKDLVQVVLGALEGNVSDVHLEGSRILGMFALLDVELDALHVAVRHGDHFKTLSQGRQAVARLEPCVAANGTFHAASTISGSHGFQRQGVCGSALSAGRIGIGKLERLSVFGLLWVIAVAVAGLGVRCRNRHVGSEHGLSVSDHGVVCRGHVGVEGRNRNRDRR